MPDISDIRVDQLLPSEEDTQTLKRNFAMRIARVLTKNMKFFKQFGSGLERHIWHEYYAEMSTKSEVVSTCYVLTSVSGVLDVKSVRYCISKTAVLILYRFHRDLVIALIKDILVLVLTASTGANMTSHDIIILCRYPWASFLTAR